MVQICFYVDRTPPTLWYNPCMYMDKIWRWLTVLGSVT